MRIRQGPFHLPLAHTNAEKPTLLDRVCGISQLCARIDIRGQKSINAAGKMFRILIGKRAAKKDQPRHAHQQKNWRTRYEIHHTPGKQYQTGLTKIGLQGQHHSDAHRQDK